MEFSICEAKARFAKAATAASRAAKLTVGSSLIGAGVSRVM